MTQQIKLNMCSCSVLPASGSVFKLSTCYFSASCLTQYMRPEYEVFTRDNWKNLFVFDHCWSLHPHLLNM